MFTNLQPLKELLLNHQVFSPRASNGIVNIIPLTLVFNYFYLRVEFMETGFCVPIKNGFLSILGQLRGLFLNWQTTFCAEANFSNLRKSGWPGIDTLKTSKYRRRNVKKIFRVFDLLYMGNAISTVTYALCVIYDLDSTFQWLNSNNKHQNFKKSSMHENFTAVHNGVTVMMAFTPLD